MRIAKVDLTNINPDKLPAHRGDRKVMSVHVSLCVCMHARVYSCVIMYERGHAHRHTRTHARTHARTHTFVRTQLHSAHKHGRTCAHACIHAHTCIRTHALIHMYAAHVDLEGVQGHA